MGDYGLLVSDIIRSPNDPTKYCVILSKALNEIQQGELPITF